MINPTDAVNRETGNQAESAPRELSAEELRFTPKIEQHFSSTRELAGAKDFVGQERAPASLELGLGVAGNGYNIFVSGLTGADKLETLRRWVDERASATATPGDWVYVHDFKHPDAPRAIYFRPGDGSKLREMMHDLVKTLREELPSPYVLAADDPAMGRWSSSTSLPERFRELMQAQGASFFHLLPISRAEQRDWYP